MDSFVSDYGERFRYLHTEVLSVLDRFPDEGLDWKFAETSNSAAVIVTHMLGAARYWIGDVACGEKSVRVRDSEFTVKNVSGEDLKRAVRECVEYIEDKLSTLSVAEMAQDRHSDSFGRTFTVGWCLLHTLEHSAIHLGHLHLLIELYEQQVKD